MPLFHRAIWRQQLRATLLYWGLIPLLVTLPGLLLDRLVGWPPLPLSAGLGGAAAACLAGGVTLVVRATRDLQHLGGGTPSPLRPARRLVTTGSYRLCRHPMFFGYDLMLFAAVLLLRSPAALGLAYPLFLVWSLVLLRREEHLLTRRFRQDYRRYQQEVPFLIPRFGRRSRRP